MRSATVACAAAAVVIGAGLGVREIGRQVADAPSTSTMPGVWDDGVKARVRTAFFETGAVYAVDTYERVARLLDRYAEALTAMQSETRGAELSELRMQCLDRRAGELSALTSVFAKASESGVVEHAVAATTALTDVHRCSDEATLRATVRLPTDAGARRRIGAVRAKLDEAQSLARAGQLHRGLELARQVAADAASVAHASLEAEALSLLGVLQREVSDHPSAEATFRDAERAAARAHDDVQRAVILTDLFELVGHLMARHGDGMALREAADEAILRASDLSHLRARFSSCEAEVLQQAGRRDEALRAAERAVRLWEKTGQNASLDLAHALHSHARILGGLERYKEARHSAERALAIYRNQLGPEHPDVGRSYKYIGDFLMMRGRYADARPYYQRAIAIAERSVGHESKDIRGAYNGLAAVLQHEGELDEALRYYSEALAISDRIATSDSSAAILLNMAEALRALRRSDEARRACERARGILEAGEASGRANPINIPTALDCLAQLRSDERDYAGAVALFQRALSHYEGSSLDTPSHAATLLHLGQTYLAMERAREALPLLERAVAVYDTHECDGSDTGDAHFALARALSTTAADRARAITLAERARDDYSAAGAWRDGEREKVSSWLNRR